MYIIDLKKLKKGDIILTTSSGFTSKVVKTLTKSNFSHAILYLGDGESIHSTHNGVHSENLQRVLFKKESYVKVLRIINLTDDTLNKVEKFARNEIGKQYSIPDTMKIELKKINIKNPKISSKINKSLVNDTNRQFCSRLVAEAYEYAGIKLVNNSFCSPQDLDDSIHTIEIKKCVRIAKEEEITFVKTSSPIKKQTEITNQIFKNIRLITGEDIQTFEQVLKYLVQNPEYDKSVTKIVKESGYLDMWKWEFEKNIYRYNLDSFFYYFQNESKEKILEIIEKELEIGKGMKKQHVNNLKFTTNHFNQVKFHLNMEFDYLKMNLELYTHLLERVNLHLTTMNQAKSYYLNK